MEENEQPLPDWITRQKWYTDDEVWDMVERKLSEHYGVEIKIRDNEED